MVRKGKCKYEEKCAYDHDKSSKEKEKATFNEAVANILKRHDDEILEMKQEMTQMKSNMLKLEEELSLFKLTRSETNLHVNTRSAVKQTKRNIESIPEVPNTKEVMDDEPEKTKSSEGNIIQNEETNLNCQFCSNKYKTDKMLRIMKCSHVTCVKGNSKTNMSLMTIG